MNTIVKLKKDGTPKKSGGKREGSGREMKTVTEQYGPWDKQLKRALRLASNNMFILKRDSFFSKTQIKEIFGQKALEEFSFYFNSVLRFDQDRADKVSQKKALGLYVVPPPKWPEKALGFYSPEKYANWLKKHKCYGWLSVLKEEHHADLWMEYADNGKI